MKSDAIRNMTDINTLSDKALLFRGGSIGQDGLMCQWKNDNIEN
jgi:hypothetical protein